MMLRKFSIIFSNSFVPRLMLCRNLLKTLVLLRSESDIYSGIFSVYFSQWSFDLKSFIPSSIQKRVEYLFTITSWFNSRWLETRYHLATFPFSKTLEFTHKFMPEVWLFLTPICLWILLSFWEQRRTFHWPAKRKRRASQRKRWTSQRERWTSQRER